MIVVADDLWRRQPFPTFRPGPDVEDWSGTLKVRDARSSRCRHPSSVAVPVSQNAASVRQSGTSGHSTSGHRHAARSAHLKRLVQRVKVRTLT